MLTDPLLQNRQTQLESGKTGQSIDLLKEQVLIPSLGKMIGEDFARWHEPLDVFDFGPGDVSSTRALVKALRENHLKIGMLALFESDTAIFPSALSTLLINHPQDFRGIDLTLSQAHQDLALTPFQDENIQAYDVFNAQMVMHQLPTQAHLGLALLRASLALRPHGHAYLSDLHPKAIEEMQLSEPGKISINPERPEAPATYRFDSGGSAPLFRRELVDVLSEAIAAGLTLQKINYPAISAEVQSQNARSHRLTEKGIPMFYQMNLVKSPDRPLSYLEGAVETVAPGAEAFLKIGFYNGVTIIIPRLASLPEVRPEDHLILSSVPLTANRQSFNLWGLPEKDTTALWRSSWTQTTLPS